MMLEWNAYRDELLATIGDLGRVSPDTIRGYRPLSDAGTKTDLHAHAAGASGDASWCGRGDDETVGSGRVGRARAQSLDGENEGPFPDRPHFGSRDRREPLLRSQKLAVDRRSRRLDGEQVLDTTIERPVVSGDWWKCLTPSPA
jgi:hypothetical protein